MSYWFIDSIFNTSESSFSLFSWQEYSVDCIPRILSLCIAFTYLGFWSICERSSSRMVWTILQRVQRGYISRWWDSSERLGFGKLSRLSVVHIIIIYSLGVFPISDRGCSFSEVWVTASLLGSPGVSILDVPIMAVVWIVSTRPPTFKSSSPFNNILVTVRKATITIGIIVTFMFHVIFQFVCQSPIGVYACQIIF